MVFRRNIESFRKFQSFLDCGNLRKKLLLKIFKVKNLFAEEKINHHVSYRVPVWAVQVQQQELHSSRKNVWHNRWLWRLERRSEQTLSRQPLFWGTTPVDAFRCLGSAALPTTASTILNTSEMAGCFSKYQRLWCWKRQHELVSGPSQSLMCENGNCVPLRVACDATDDCGDRSDEREICSDESFFCNAQTAFQCSDGSCLPKRPTCGDEFACNSDIIQLCEGSLFTDSWAELLIIHQLLAPEQTTRYLSPRAGLLDSNFYGFFLKNSLRNILVSGFHKGPDQEHSTYIIRGDHYERAGHVIGTTWVT